MAEPPALDLRRYGRAGQCVAPRVYNIPTYGRKMSQQQRERVSAFDRAKASFNSPQRSGYFDLYDSDLILHGFPSNLPANFEGLRMFYNSMWTAFPDSNLEFDDIVVQGAKS
jgi:hypothetical protein